MADKKRFVDRVLRFMGIEEEVAASHDVGTSQTSTTLPQPGSEESHGSRRRTRSTVVETDRTNARMRMIVLEPHQFNDVQSIADHLLQREPVVLRLDNVDKDTARRIVDFLGGTTYALGGHIQRLGEQMFLLAPHNVDIDTHSVLTDDQTRGEHFS